MAGAATRPRLIVAGPLPPPLHGVTISTSLVLANQRLRERFDVAHLDTSDHRTGENIGRWDTDNVRIALLSTLRLVWMLRGRPGLVYLPLSQNRSAFLRDSLFILLSRLFGWKVAIHLRGSDFPAFYRSLSRLERRWVAFTMRRVDGVGVMGRSLRFVFGGLVPPERVAVVHNGTPDPGVTASPAESQEVLFLSNLRTRKGVEQAVQAARIVTAARDDVRFRFVGAWESPELRERVTRGVDPERIVFAPPVRGEEKDRAFASAAALLFTPIEPEGHPRVVLEAIAAGLPVVATDRGAIRETVVDGESGYVLEEADPPSLAARVLRLMEDPDLRRRMGAAARSRYESTFTQPLADEMLADWLARVAAGSPDGAG